MITALKQKVTIKSGGLVRLRSNKLKPGARAEVIVLVEPSENSMTQAMTAADLLKSGLVGIWADRKEIGDSLEFARALRKQAETRSNEA